jgi:hypothetical protein
MGLRADDAWRKAAQCARLAQQADDDAERELYLRMRDAWISVANRCDFLDVVADPAPPADGLPSGAGPPSSPFLPLGFRGR